MPGKKRVILLIIMVAVLVIAPILAFFPSGESNDADEMMTIEVWQVDSFEGGKGSRAQYLADMAKECFSGERVYVTVTSLSAEAVRSNIEAGNIPDIISYGAGMYGIENVINSNGFTYKCWCRGAYFLISLKETDDFSDASSDNTVVNLGKDNFAEACALFEGLENADFAAPTSAYVSLIGGKYKYLLGTQRDLFRLETREQGYSAKVITSFNDLYQNISITCSGEKYNNCVRFVNYLSDTTEGVAALGLFSKGVSYTGAMGEAARASFDYKHSSYADEEYIKELKDAVKNRDLNYLKNLLK